MELLAYPSKPKFVVMEHSMRVGGYNLSERREAHIQIKNGERNFVMLVVRAIDHQTMRTVVRRQPGQEDEIEDLDTDTMWEGDKDEFFAQWAGLWIPKMPDEDHASPLMLEIAHVEPYPIQYPTEEWVESDRSPLLRRPAQWENDYSSKPRKKQDSLNLSSKTDITKYYKRAGSDEKAISDLKDEMSKLRQHVEDLINKPADSNEPDTIVTDFKENNMTSYTNRHADERVEGKDPLRMVEDDAEQIHVMEKRLQNTIDEAKERVDALESLVKDLSSDIRQLKIVGKNKSTTRRQQRSNSTSTSTQNYRTFPRENTRTVRERPTQRRERSTPRRERRPSTRERRPSTPPWETEQSSLRRKHLTVSARPQNDSSTWESLAPEQTHKIKKSDYRYASKSLRKKSSKTDRPAGTNFLRDRYDTSISRQGEYHFGKEKGRKGQTVMPPPRTHIGPKKNGILSRPREYTGI